MRRKSALMGKLCAATVLVLGLSVAAFGQLGKGVISGTVTDPSDASVPGATVTLINEGTGSSRSVTTNTAGHYRFDFTDVGSYTLKVSATNFSSVEIKNVVLTVAQTVTEDVKLELARGAGQTITVEGTGVQLVRTDKSEVSSLVDRNTLAALPLEVRDPGAFINLLPGAIPSSIGNIEFNGSTRGSAVNGARGGMGNFVLDGVDNNDQGQGGRSHNSVGSMPGAITGISPDAILEFRVITNNFSAQYGRQAGFVADAVLRPGTNQIHGSLFEYNRNQSITAQDFFSNSFGVKDSLVRNQFGGSLGGPIRRDKTFVFGTVELQTLRQSVPQIVTSVTPDFINFVDSGAFANFMENDPGGLCGGGPACVGTFANSAQLGPIASSLLQQFPMPVPTSNFTNDTGGLLQALGAPITYPVPIFGDADVRNDTVFNENRFSIKLDHNISDTHRLYGFMAFDDFDTTDSSLGGDGISPHFPAEGASRAQNWALSYTWTITPSLVNDAKASYLRHSSGFPRQVSPEIPSIVTGFDPLAISFGHTAGFPQRFKDNQFQFQDHVAWTRGKHNVRFGGEYRRTRNGSVFHNANDGFFLPYDTENLLTDGWFGSELDALFFQGDFLGSFVLLEASVNPLTGQVPEPYRGFRANEFGAYVQDDWKIHSRVTLNLGIRWDYFGPPHNFRPGFDSNFYFGPATGSFPAPFTPPDPLVPGSGTAPNPFFPVNSPEYEREGTATFIQKDSDIWAKDKNNFAPRFGLAWDVGGNQKTVIRFGGGVFYDRIWNNLFENIRFNPPLFSLNDVGFFINGVTASPTATPGLYSIPVNNALFANPAFGAVPNPRHMDEYMRAPYIEQFSFGIQRELGQNFLFETNYIGTIGHKLTGVVDLNTFPGLNAAGVDPVSQLPFDNSRPNQNIARDNARGNYYNSNYHALQFQLIKRMSRGIQFQTNYTWAKALDYMSDAFQNRASVGGVGIRPMDTANRHLDYGRSDFDTRHRFVTSFIYDMPFWRQNRWAGGWTIGSNIVLQTGLPFSVVDSGTDHNQDGSFTDRPDFLAPGNPDNLAFNHDISPADDGYLRTQYFAAPALEPGVNMGLWRNGRLGRNALSSPGFANVDFSLQKKFRITERFTVRLDVNFFNIFNRVNFAAPEGDMSAGDFGRSTATYGPRVGQLAARIDF